MTYDLPPISKSAERLLLDIERAVRGFARYHKYAIGKDLRDQAMQVSRLCNRAWRDRARQAEWTEQLVWAIDELKLSLQLGKQVQAFRSFRQFEELIRIAEDLGKQAGGWKRQQQHPKGQNSSSCPTHGARPDTEYPCRPVAVGANP